MYETNNNLYLNLPKDILLTEFSRLAIPFDETWKRIGVNLSGGADSALLTYFLCKIISDNNLKTKIYIITYQRCWETRPWQGHVSRQVYKWFQQRYPDIIAERITTYIPPELEHGAIGPIINGRSGDQIIVGSFNKFAAWEHNLDAVFNATSQNFDKTREDRMANRDRTAENGILADLWMQVNSVDSVFVHPFKFVKKDWIVAQYHLHKILDLYNITRSCEGDINHHAVIKDAIPHFKKYVPGMTVPECHQCWWCEERAWAESRVEKTITEILK